jgi:hypothetical protein
MDRVISLLAALVGLIALGGAILVHVNADAQRSELESEIAGLRDAMATTRVPAVSIVSSPEPALASSSELALAAALPSSSPAASSMADASSSAVPGDPVAVQLKSLQDRIAELEQQNDAQASELADARAKLAAGADVSPVPQLVAPSSSSAVASPSSVPAEAVASGPASDCIPLGTRFMAKIGDKFAICKTTAVVKVAGVEDGTAIIEGAGPITAGSFGDLTAKGCTIMVFSADATGYAEMRVTCQ